MTNQTTAGKTKGLTDNEMSREDARRMARRRAKDAGILTPIGCRTFWATGITNYLEIGAALENARVMAAHESTRTTKLHDRRNDQVALDEVEPIAI